MAYSDHFNPFISQSSYFESSQTSGIEKRSVPKGFLTEYQHSYLNFGCPKVQKQKIKDTLSFESKSLLNNSEWQSQEEQSQTPRSEKLALKSKVLDRLNNLIPEKDSRGFPPIQPTNKTNLTSSSINAYQTEYLKLFDDVNKGFADSYTTSKGGVLLNKKEKKEATNNDSESKFESPSQSKLVTHDSDFRSVWIPKKFEGRNMFASHIDRAMFPEKIEENVYETVYNKMHDTNADLKKSIEKPSYEPIEKVVRYIINHENQQVPVIKWTPRIPEKQRKTTPPGLFSSKSVYKADYKIPGFEFRSYPIKPRESTEVKKILNQPYIYQPYY